MASPQPSFGAILRRHRVGAGLTQEELAERAGISVRGISDLERGVNIAPREDTVHRLADALDLAEADREVFTFTARELRLSARPHQSSRPAEVQVRQQKAASVPLRRGSRLLLWNPGRLTYVIAVTILALVTTVLVLARAKGASERAGSHASASWQVAAIWGSSSLRPVSFQSPAGVAVDRHGNVYVTDARLSVIVKLSSSGQLLAEWGRPGRGLGEFASPSGLVVDRQGNVYVADTGNNRVQKLSSLGLPVAQWGVDARHLKDARSVADDGQGNVYVADSGDGRLLKISPDGRLLRVWNVPARAVAADAHGNVDVLNIGDSTYVQQLSPGGEATRVFLSNPANPLERPGGITVDSNGSLYVADTGNDRIQQVLKGGFVPAVEDGTLRSPGGLTTDSQGNVYVADTGHHRIVKLSRRLGLLGTWRSAQPGPSRFLIPSAVTVNIHGDVYVADTGNDRIQMLSPDGRVLRTWRSRQGGTELFSDAKGLAVDSQGTLYVADALAQRIDVIAPNGRLRGRWYYQDFQYPSSVAVDARNHVYVVDDLHVFEFSSGGRFLAEPVGKRAGKPFFPFHGGPQGVAVDAAGYLYVATDSNVIYKLTPKYGLAGVFAGPAPPFGEDSSLEAVALDGNGNIYGLDPYQGVVHEFPPDGKVMASWDEQGPGVGQLNTPRGLAVDRQGNVYIADTGNNRILKISHG